MVGSRLSLNEESSLDRASKGGGLAFERDQFCEMEGPNQYDHQGVVDGGTKPMNNSVGGVN